MQCRWRPVSRKGLHAGCFCPRLIANRQRKQGNSERASQKARANPAINSIGFYSYLDRHGHLFLAWVADAVEGLGLGLPCLLGLDVGVAFLRPVRYSRTHRPCLLEGDGWKADRPLPSLLATSGSTSRRIRETYIATRCSGDV